MFDIGWSEMALIMLVALIVIGPKDLPRVARNVGKWVAKGRALAREFQSQLEDMAREAELDKVKSEIEKAGRTDLKRSIERQIDPKGDLKNAFDVEAKDKDGKPGAAAPAATSEPDEASATATPAERPATRAGANGADGADPAGSEHDATGEASGAAAREKAPTH